MLVVVGTTSVHGHWPSERHDVLLHGRCDERGWVRYCVSLVTCSHATNGARSADQRHWDRRQHTSSGRMVATVRQWWRNHHVLHGHGKPRRAAMLLVYRPLAVHRLRSRKRHRIHVLSDRNECRRIRLDKFGINSGHTANRSRSTNGSHGDSWQYASAGPLDSSE